MKKRLPILLLIGVVAISTVLSTGCKKKNKNIEGEPTITETPAPTQETTPTPTPTEVPENREGQVQSKLTGEWVPEEEGNKRPYAIMFNNISYASPQSGTEEAAVLYEALAEGGITRLMGIFEELNEKRIGSIRSARHYFVSFADEYDSIYVHYGETKYATQKIKALGIDNLSGLTGIEPTVFYRDKSIKAPHNAFASRGGILEGTKIKKYRTEYKEGHEGHFSFYQEDTELVSDEVVKKASFKFSPYTTPYFTYNEEDKLYYRFQFGSKHIDPNSGNQLAFKNIIVQFVKEWDIDKNDYQTMDLEDASGNGFYITNGKKVDITWTKNEQTKKMRYLDASGNVLKMNQGKTFIVIFPNNQTSNITLSDSISNE